MSVVIQEKNFNKAPPVVEIIKPRKRNNKINKVIKKKKTAAYCRVSTDSDEQELSFETQCEYYRNFISNHPDYILVDVYADDGISGTSLSKRDGFNQMMEDAVKGKIDFIITKSITRFARNTVDCLKCLRILKEHNVDVYFEMENIHSIEGGEMLITILSSLAQESSQEKSDSVKWGYRRQFEKGKVYASNLYGYKSNKGTLLIIEEEAKIVREIYAMYLDGMSDRNISLNLTQRGIRTKQGKKKWNASAIRNILTNQKYTGNSINGKTYNVDFLHPKRLKNTGQAPMYIVENSHPAIITQEIFDQVQIERARKVNNSSAYKDMKGTENNGRFQTVNTLSGKIICSNCGSLYRRAVWTKRNGDKEPVWRCANRLKNGKRACQKSATIKEKKLFNELRFVINDVLTKKKDIVNQIANKASKYTNPKDIVTEIKYKNEELKEVNQMISKILNEGMLLISRGVQDEEGLKEHLDKYYKKKKILLKDIEHLEQKLKSIREIRERKILKTLQNYNYAVDELSQEEIAVFIQDIIVKSKIIQITITNGEIYTIPIEKVK